VLALLLPGGLGPGGRNRRAGRWAFSGEGGDGGERGDDGGDAGVDRHVALRASGTPGAREG